MKKRIFCPYSHPPSYIKRNGNQAEKSNKKNEWQFHTTREIGNTSTVDKNSVFVKKSIYEFYVKQGIFKLYLSILFMNNTFSAFLAIIVCLGLAIGSYFWMLQYAGTATDGAAIPSPETSALPSISPLSSSAIPADNSKQIIVPKETQTGVRNIVPQIQIVTPAPIPSTITKSIENIEQRVENIEVQVENKAEDLEEEIKALTNENEELKIENAELENENEEMEEEQDQNEEENEESDEDDIPEEEIEEDDDIDHDDPELDEEEDESEFDN